MREKVTASFLFRNRKESYARSVAHPFQGDYVRLRQNGQWRKMVNDTTDHYIVFADIVSKITRSSGRVSYRITHSFILCHGNIWSYICCHQLSPVLFVLSTSSMMILDQRTLNIKYRVPAADVVRISLSPFMDDIAVFHIKSVSWLVSLKSLWSLDAQSLPIRLLLLCCTPEQSFNFIVIIFLPYRFAHTVVWLLDSECTELAKRLFAIPATVLRRHRLAVDQQQQMERWLGLANVPRHWTRHQDVPRCSERSWEATWSQRSHRVISFFFKSTFFYFRKRNCDLSVFFFLLPCSFEASVGHQLIELSFRCLGMPEVQPGQVRITRRGHRLDINL